ncbi:MAG: polysaccharide biosynthesis/export family protein [Isosphaeraceae bacterium]
MPPLPQRTRPAIPEGNPFEDLAGSQEQTDSGPVRPQQRPEYIIEPPDLVIVEVLEALPGRPISGERLVRPDGRISLGFYGDIPATGCTINQLKERIVLHLRKFINDEVLGLVERDLETGDLKRDPENPREILFKDPRETDRVFVDVTAYNSSKVYVVGDVLVPGILPYTGSDTVLDLIELTGGLISIADQDRIRLIRSFPKGSPVRVLPVDYKQIAMGTDSSTNYAILPGDRLVIPRLKIVEDTLKRQRESAAGLPEATSRPRADRHTQPSIYFNRRTPLPSNRPNEEMEKRMEELEKKLDTLIQAVEKLQPKPGAGPEPPRDEADGGGRLAPANPAAEEAAPLPSYRDLGPADRSPRGRRRGADETRPGPRRPRPDVPRAEMPF